MGATFLITAREGFEAALLLGLVYASLNRLGRHDQFRNVTIGAWVGFLASVLMGIAVTVLSGPLLDLGPDLVGAAVEDTLEAGHEAIDTDAIADEVWRIFAEHHALTQHFGTKLLHELHERGISVSAGHQF